MAFAHLVAATFGGFFECFAGGFAGCVGKPLLSLVPESIFQVLVDDAALDTDGAQLALPARAYDFEDEGRMFTPVNKVMLGVEHVAACLGS